MADVEATLNGVTQPGGTALKRKYKDLGDGTFAEVVHVSAGAEEPGMADIEATLHGITQPGGTPLRKRYKDMGDGTYAEIVYLSAEGEEQGDGDVEAVLHGVTQPGGTPLRERYKDMGDGTFARVLYAGSVFFDYYVDSVAGSDNNEGTENAPFATLSKVSTVLADGVRIALKRGSHWREELNIGSFSRVVVVAYGDGERPLLDASDIIASGSWTKSAGLTNVYQQTLGLNNVASGFLSVWEDAARLTRATSAALCDSSPGSMYASTDNGTSTTIYIHPTGSSNPTSNGKVYEYSARNYGLGGRGADYLTVRGIATRRNANIGGSLWTGRYARIVDCKASDGNNHCLQYKDGSYLERVTAEDCYYTLDQPTHFVCYEDVPIGLGVQHVKCVARQNGAQPTAYGFFAHRSSGGHFGTITYDDCEVVNIVRGWGGSSAFFVVNDPIYSGTLGAAFFLGGEADFTINRGSYTGLQNLVRAAMGDDQRVTLNAVTAASANSTLSFGTGVDRVRLSINGSDLTELNTDAGSTAVVIIQGVDATLISRGNRLRAGSNHYPYFTSTGTVLDSDNNAFRSGNRFRINGVTYNDFAAYRAAFPTQDANSTSTAI